MGDMVVIVVPLRGVEAWTARGLTREQAGGVVVVLQHEVDVAVGGWVAHPAGDLDQQVLVGVVLDLVDGVEAQARRSGTLRASSSHCG
jgi:hypothetical protein